jgi:small subunit ribosomal protein S8
MVTTDPIADMLVRLKNAGNAGVASVEVPFSALKLAIANVLLKEGYVSTVVKKIKKAKTTEKVIEIGVAYESDGSGATLVRRPRISGLVRVSKPSRRVYSGANELKPINQGHGIAILSTPKGVLSNTEARKEHVGGEVLCKAW